MFVKPWDEASKRILDQIVHDRSAFTSDRTLPRLFGHKYPELINKEFLAIGDIHKTRETVFTLRRGVMIVPMIERTSRNSKYPKYKFFKI
jgi:hypothetical protein